MSRIIIFGDSNSYGNGLKDPLVENYGYRLGQLINKQVINKAWGGSSNTRIAYTVLNFDFEPGDIVILGWTYASREMLAKAPCDITNFGIWLADPSRVHDIPIYRVWLEYFYDDYDLAIKSFMHMHHINLYLKQKNLKSIQFWFEEFPKTFALKKEYIWADSIKMDFELLEEVQHVDITSCNHPGPKTHQIFAEYLYKNFKEILE